MTTKTSGVDLGNGGLKRVERLGIDGNRASRQSIQNFRARRKATGKGEVYERDANTRNGRAS